LPTTRSRPWWRSPRWAAASSIALVGFGLIILWQFRPPIPEARERRALRLIALSFFALAGDVTVESLRSLLAGEAPDPSPAGIAIAALSLLVMPMLSWAQRRTGRALGSSTVVADSKQTLLCTYLSAVLLVGLVLNSVLGWWWADPLVGLVIAGLAVREGREAWHGQGCTCIPTPEVTDGPACGCEDEDCAT
jgi:hypothetical protein